MLRTESLSVSVGDFSIRDVSLTINSNEYFIILGPTGAGKTVLLETIAGVYRPGSGRILFDGQDITRTEPWKRNFGIVYQDCMLFPHLTVEENVSFGLRHKGIPISEQNRMVEEMLSLLEIRHLNGRYPASLSGGEQQRVALARALVTKPGILLLDEPFSALDVKTREKMRVELSRLHRYTGTTIIQITHSFDDVFALADRIAIFREGAVVQVGETTEVFLHPSERFVAEFLGIGNILRGSSSPDHGLARITTTSGTVFHAVSDLHGDVIATIPAEDVLLSRSPLVSSARNCLRGTVSDIIPAGSTVRVVLDAGFPLTALLTRESCRELELVPGSPIFATFKASAVHVIPGAGGEG